jgi:nucleosome assembly protein 1-like 1
VNELDEEEDSEYRKLELKYDKLYQEIYEERRKIVMGEIPPNDDLLQEYGKRAEELKDDDYPKIEVGPCDVKDIQNTTAGVSGFWLKAMLNHPGISRIIQEKDRPILMYLVDI